VANVTLVITVRYFAGARAATGVDEEKLPVNGAQPLTDLSRQLAHRHGPALERVLAAASFLVNEVASAPGGTVEPGAVVDVLPPFAGG
jgi:sulfur-carrier protein